MYDVKVIDGVAYIVKYNIIFDEYTIVRKCATEAEAESIADRLCHTRGY